MVGLKNIKELKKKLVSGHSWQNFIAIFTLSSLKKNFDI